jgi:hypothetical protein
MRAATTTSPNDDTPYRWWPSNRLRYNLIVLVSAALSVICLFLLSAVFERRLPCLEITGFTLMFGAILLCVSLGLANVLYYLGPAAEAIFRPKDVTRFRIRLFALGTGFSILLIFLPVIGNSIAAITYPSGTETCLG